MHQWHLFPTEDYVFLPKALIKQNPSFMFFENNQGYYIYVQESGILFKMIREQ